MEDGDEWQMFIHPQEQKIELEIKMKSVYLKKTSSDFHKSRNCKDRFDIYVYESKVDAPIRLIEEREREIEKRLTLNMREVADNVYFLPASRSGIDTAMSSFGPILAQLSPNRASIRGGIQIPSIPEPISDYYVELSAIKTDGYEHFGEIASEIEQKILKGKVVFDNKKKTITYNGENTDYSLEMSDVSSMVSEISPITAYLKYIVKKEKTWINRQGVVRRIAAPKSIIFIEEPEAHLHPKNQVALLKIFVQLTKQNVKLVMASHSNYIFNELNNLILGKELKVDMYAPILMSQEGIKSSTRFMKADELGVSDENFCDTAEMLYLEREQLIQKIMQEAEQDEQE